MKLNLENPRHQRIIRNCIILYGLKDGLSEALEQIKHLSTPYKIILKYHPKNQLLGKYKKKIKIT